jgi:hypothetical protein
MDMELTQHLDAMEGRMNAHVDQRVRESEKRVVTLITEVKESLERQMNMRFEEVNHRFDAVDARFDAQANRLDRQAALIQTGSRWSNRMTAWAERVDLALDKKSEQIIDLHKRIDKTEGGAK